MSTLDEADLRGYITGTLGFDVRTTKLDEKLFSTGHIDSFAMIDLIMFLEERMARRIPPKDITLDNFDRLADILTYVNAGASQPKAANA